MLRTSAHERGALAWGGFGTLRLQDVTPSCFNSLVFPAQDQLYGFAALEITLSRHLHETQAIRNETL